MNNNGNTQHSSFGSGMGDSQQGMGGAMEEPGSGQGFGESGGMSGGMKNVASKAGEKLMNTAEQQKRAGADFVTDMAGSVRRAAGEFEEQMPQAAHYIRYAADQMETMSDSLRRRDIGQMMADVQSFARRQPTAFLGMSFLAGFAAVRFLRSGSPASAQRSSGGESGMWDDEEAVDTGRYGAPQAGETRYPGSGSGM
ncbi:YtxH domain-containing protein [Aestuariivirga sp.]|uniref:YtxH domain-containing protein n=1 Tax=Aestuariivirga sp. TaxID=2650926 RepID=UPI003918791D